jgi:phage terminase large subunit
VDDPEKIKSTDWNIIFMEEASEFTLADFIQLNLRKRSPTSNDEVNQIILAHNPTDVFGYINDELVQKRGIIPFHSTYKDNPYLPEEYVKELELLGKQNPDYWKIYGLGEYAQLEDIIFNPFHIIDVFPPRETLDEVFLGLDFGFNNESALIRVGVKDRWNLYTKELLYKSGLTNADLIKSIKALGINEIDPIYCDSSEPDRILELKRSGLNAKPMFKGKNSVKDGIDYLKRFTIHTTPENVNLNKERSAYCWKRDAHDRITDEPIKRHDHLLDGLRGSVYTALGKRKEVGVVII